MVKRKLIRFGKNSFVISLPKEWIDANKSVPIGVMARVKRWGGLRVVAGKDGDPQLPRHDYVPSCGTYLDVSAADISANFEAGMQLCWSAI